MALLLRNSNRLFAVRSRSKTAWRQTVFWPNSISRSRSVAEKKLHRRKFSTTFAKFSQDFQQQGIPGSNLPFGIGCKYKLTLGFLVYFLVGLNVPFILMRHVLLSANEEPEDPGQQELSQTVCFMEKEVDEQEEDEQDMEPSTPTPCSRSVKPACRL